MMSQFFQILDFNEQLGSCCSDYGMVSILDIIRQALELIQLIVPIILIVALVIQFTQMMANPENKKNMKSLTNKFVAAILCFVLPIIINATMALLPQTEDFQLSSCWKLAKLTKEYNDAQKTTYIPTSQQKYSFLTNPDDYDEGSSGDSESGTGSALGQSIVQYAKSFVGQSYVYGGYWNGELPYTGTDCSGFVQGVFKHHGINLARDTYSQWGDTGSYTLVSPNDIQAGDLVMYDGHVGILTGNGREMVHAQSTATGIVISSDYTTCSSKQILGIMRIHGVS